MYSIKDGGMIVRIHSWLYKKIFVNCQQNKIQMKSQSTKFEQNNITFILIPTNQEYSAKTQFLIESSKTGLV